MALFSAFQNNTLLRTAPPKWAQLLGDKILGKGEYGSDRIIQQQSNSRRERANIVVENLRTLPINAG